MTVINDEIVDLLKGSMLSDMPHREALKTLKN